MGRSMDFSSLYEIVFWKILNNIVFFISFPIHAPVFIYHQLPRNKQMQRKHFLCLIHILTRPYFHLVNKEKKFLNKDTVLSHSWGTKRKRILNKGIKEIQYHV